MTRRRWIADEVSGNTAALVGSHAAHLARVLRAEIGQEFDIATGDAVRRGRIVSISNSDSNSKARVEFALGEVAALKPAPEVTLALAIFKFDRMEWAIEKCTEIGVARIIPIIARRTEAHLAAAAMKRSERWQRIALQASEQSRRAAPPEIATPVTLKDLGSAGAPPAAQPQTGTTNCRIVLAESEGNTHLRDVLRPQLPWVVLAIGPEGGWTAEELQWFRDSEWIAASLGDTILRAETAAIVATALALDSLR
ncbi:MAG: RsmE family RNA methyltransferase [Terriglobales bacterium]